MFWKNLGHNHEGHEEHKELGDLIGFSHPVKS